MTDKVTNLETLKQAIIDLYQIVKIRKQSDTQNIDNLFLEQEKLSLSSISPIVLIDYIKIHLTLLIDIKVSEKLSQLKTNPLEFVSFYGTDIPCNQYEKLLRRYESDIRNYIKIENMLKIHIDELNYKQELLQKQLEQLKNQSLNFMQTTHSIEYKKKIDELTALVETYEKHNLKIPLLEKKIKVQKIELDKLDTYYKKQLRAYSRKIEEYEKGIFLNQNLNLNLKQHTFNNKNYELTSLPNNNKTKSRINISPPKIINNTIVGHRYNEINLMTNDEKTINIPTKKTMNIFEKIHKNTIEKINRNISENNERNLYVNSNEVQNGKSKENFGNYNKNNISSNNNINNNRNKNILSPSSSFFNSKKTSDNIYDSIEINSEEKNNKTINLEQNFHKKNLVKSNTNTNITYSSSNTHKKNSIKKIYKLNEKNRNSSKIGSNLKKIQIAKNNLSNNNLTKIPKNIKDSVYTLSKHNLCKGENIKFNRYRSQKQLINDNELKKNKKEDSFNKTFSKIPCVSNMNAINNFYNGSSKTNKIKSHRGTVKNFIFKKISNTTILNCNENINLNGKSPIPIKKSQSKTKSFANNK